MSPMTSVRAGLATLTIGALLLTACTGGNGAAPTAAEPSADAAEASAAPGSGDGGSAEDPSPSASSTATPEPTPTPTPTAPPVVVTGDDLLVGLPTNKQMSKVQGYRFIESDNWVDGSNAGPQWVRTAPLTKKQRRELALGALRKVKPARCDVVASFGDWWGIPAELSTRDYVTAAGYSFRANDYQYYKANKMNRWYTVALVLPPGQAQLIVDDMLATREACRKYTVVTRDGDLERVNNSDVLIKGKTTYRTGDALVTRVRLTGNGPAGQVRYIVSEAIGDIYYLTDLNLNSSGKGILGRASEVYNKLADNLARVSGVTREPLDLNDLQKATGDPADYVPLTPAVGSGAVA